MIPKRRDNLDDVLVSIKNDAQADRLEIFEARDRSFGLAFKDHEGVIHNVLTQVEGETAVAGDLEVADLAVTGDLTITGTTTFNGPVVLGDAATDPITVAGTIIGSLVFEGTTDNGFETTFAPGDPTADRTVTLPDITGTVVVSEGAQTINGIKTFGSGIVLPAGSVGTPSVQIGAVDTGLYQVSATQTGFSQDGVLVALFDTNGVMADSVRARVEPGTPAAGVTAVTYGDGVNFTTVLTVAQTNAITVADNAALADGSLLYTFPAGEILITGASMSIGVTLAEDTTATADVGLGTLQGSDAQATLDADDAACENILTGQTAADCNGTATVKTVGNQVLVIATADAHTVYFNIADTWADTAGADLTGDIAGTVTLKWTLM